MATVFQESLVPLPVEYIPPFLVTKCVRFREISRANLTGGSKAHISDSGCINEDLFLKRFGHLHKPASPGKYMLILDRLASHWPM